VARIHLHRTGAVRGFTRKYGVKLLVWFEQHATMDSAITREKQIKKWNRAWKLELIEGTNPEWRDLAEDFGFEPLSSSPRMRGPSENKKLGSRLRGNDE
jgi:putative endonuclease